MFCFLSVDVNADILAWRSAPALDINMLNNFIFIFEGRKAVSAKLCTSSGIQNPATFQKKMGSVLYVSVMAIKLNF